MNRFCLVIFMGIVISASLLTSCWTVEPVTDFEDLIERLCNAGGTAEIKYSTVRNLHLSEQGSIIAVEGENVLVFEYEDAD